MKKRYKFRFASALASDAGAMEAAVNAAIAEEEAAGYALVRCDLDVAPRDGALVEARVVFSMAFAKFEAEESPVLAWWKRRKRSEAGSGGE